MANNKKFITKNGLRTQNIQMASANNANAMELALSNADALTLAGDAGTLLTVNDTTTGNTLVVNGNILATAITAAITGNSSTATALQTARTINGTSFDGTANITTQTWGTSRDITIGSTTRSVNGSTNLTWSLADIGAAAASHTHAISDVTGLQTALDGKIASTEKGAANGVAPLGADSKIAAVYLPSYVDDVLEYANLAGFPGTGETGKIYVALDTNRTYRWSGTVYVEISPSPGTTDALLEGTTNLYFTEARARTAVVQDVITDAVTDRAPSQNAVFDALAGKANTTHTHAASDITSGTLAVARGGTGISSYTVGNYIRASGTTALEQRTPAQVLSDIGAAAASHTHAISDVTGLQTALDGKIASTEKGAANGVAPLGADSKISSVYLPSYVDDVLEYSTIGNFPATGETGKIYVTVDTNRTYRWSGTVYVEISPSPGTTDALLEGTTNLYFTATRARDAVVQDAITDGVTDRAPSQNAVFDALALKANTSSLGTAAAQNIGTSGATVPLLSAANTWSGDNRFTSNPRVKVASGGGYFVAEKASATDVTGVQFRNELGAIRWALATGPDTDDDLLFIRYDDAGTFLESSVVLDGVSGLTTFASQSGVAFLGPVGQGGSGGAGRNLHLGRNIAGATSSFNVLSEATIQPSVTVGAFSFHSSLSTAASSFTLSNLTHFSAAQGTFGAGSSVTTQTGFSVGSSLTGAATNRAFRGQIPAGTGRWNLFMDGTADNHLSGRLLLGTTVPSGASIRTSLPITGSTEAHAVAVNAAVQSDVTSFATGFNSDLGTQAAAFTVPSLIHYRAVQGTFGAGSAVNNQIGFGASANMVGGVSNFGFYGDIPAGAGRWNFFANGTANNAFVGNVRIGSTSAPTVALDVTGDGAFSGNLTAGTTSSNRHRLNGTVGIGVAASSNVGLWNATTVGGSVNSWAVQNSVNVSSDTTGVFYGYNLAFSTQAAAFTVARADGYRVQQPTIGAGSSITNFYGFTCENISGSATNVFGFISNVAAGTNKWNFFANGTANNAFAGNVRIGSTAAPTVALDVTGDAAVSGNFGVSGVTSAARLNVGGLLSASTHISYLAQSNVGSDMAGATADYYRTNATTAAGSFTLNVLNHYIAVQSTIGAGSAVTTQHGFFAGASLIGATNNFGFRGAIPAGTGRWNLFMDGTADNYIAGSLGIGATSIAGSNLRINKTITGATTGFGVNVDGQVQSDVTGAAFGYSSAIGTQAATFTVPSLIHFRANQGSFGVGSTVSNQIGFAASAGMTGGTNNYGFYGDIPAGTSRWNFFANGTANNAFAGNVRIGSTAAPTVALDVTGAVAISSTLTVTGNATAADFIRPSDERLKKDISVLDAKKLLNPVRYKWIEDDKEDFGFLAGQVEEAYPEAVKTFDRDGITYKAVAYDKLTAVLAAQLNEAVEELRQLKARVESIEKANN